jgi:hypothetical protein
LCYWFGEGLSLGCWAWGIEKGRFKGNLVGLKEIFVATIKVATFVKSSYMAKTKQIGVRFDKILLDAVKEKHGDISPQRALNLYEDTYRKWAAGIFQVREEPKTKVVNLSQPQEKSNYTIDTKSEVPILDPTYAKQVMIKEYEEEMATLGTGTFANQRRKFLQTKISQLKK